MKSHQLERLIIAAIALHSFVLGIIMLFFPLWILQIMGWNYTDNTFFPAQTGIFLFLLGGAYGMALWYRPLAWFIVVSKALAVIFLLAEYIFNGVPEFIMLAAYFDGLMGLVTAFILRYNNRHPMIAKDAS